MSGITHFVRIKDHSGVKVAEFVGRGTTQGGIQAYTYQKRLRTSGSFTLYIHGNDPRLDLIGVDYQAEFWRRDPLIPGTYIATLPAWMQDTTIPNWYKDFEGFIRTEPIFEQLQNGRYRAIIRGRGYNDLLNSEPIMYAVGSAEASKSGPTETVAKAYVDENIGPSAGLDAAGNSRVRSGLTVEVDGATGGTWEGDRAFKNLLEVIMELSEYAPAGFNPADYMIVGTGAAAFEFKWRSGQWGLDHTAGNASGNAPIIFSPRLGSASSLVYEANYLSDTNVINIIGQGVGDNIKVVTVSGANLALSPWSRRADVIQDKRQSDNAILTDKATAKLNEKQVVRKVDGVVNQTIAIRYGPDYDGGQAYFDIGSLVTVEVDRANTQVNKKIVGITVSIQSSGSNVVENITPELQDYE